MDWALAQWAQFWMETRQFFVFDPARLLTPSMIIALLLQVCLLVCSAFFSGSETALFSLSRLDLQKLRRDRHPQSETIHALLDQPRRLIISLLCGNELVNIAATANLAGILVVLYGEQRAGWINVLVMFPLLLLVGEVTPKTIAVSHPVRISAGLVAGPLSAWARLITPVRRVVRVVAEWITTWIVGTERARENILHVDEFRTLLAEVADEGILDATERVLIDNLLWAGETEIVEIMTPRTRVHFLKADMSVPEIVDRFRKIQHPRVPVCREHHDDLVGFIHAEDVLRLILDRADLSKLTLEQIMHPPVVVPPTKYVDEMFDFFQTNNARAAAVLSEFGGVEGFITMRDVVSFIFGEVSEGVVGQELYEERDENTYEVPGDMKLTDFNDLTNFGIEDPRMTTIGGVVFRYLDRLPTVGDQVAIEGLIATVLEMEGHRLARVHVAKGALGEDEAEDDALEEAEETAAEMQSAHKDPVDSECQAQGPSSIGEPEQEEETRAKNKPTIPDESERSAEVVVLPTREPCGPREQPAGRASRKTSSGHQDAERD